MTVPAPDPTPIETPVETPPPPAPDPTPPREPEAPSDDRIGALERTVSVLADTVAGLIPKDDKPVKRPWTHYGSKS